MTFDEWLDTVERLPNSKLDNLLKLVRAQRQLAELADVSIRTRFTPPSTYKELRQEISALEAVLMMDEK